MSRFTSRLSIEEKRALQINEVSAAYGISRSAIYNLIAANKLRTIKIGKRRLVPISEAERLLHGVDSTRAEPQQDAEGR